MSARLLMFRALPAALVGAALSACLGGAPSPTPTAAGPSQGTPTAALSGTPTEAPSNGTPAPPSPGVTPSNPTPPMTQVPSTAKPTTPAPATPPPATSPPATSAPNSLSYCQLSCVRVQDCIGTGPLNDADNYVCEGVCRWTGCTDTLECRSALGPGYQCADVYGTGLSSCVKTCNRPADCGTDTPANDADNYACEDNLCRWTGCVGSAECVASYGSGYTCGAESGGLSYCVPKCQTARDCALDSGTYSADNYSCEAGACLWLGCFEDNECEATYQANTWTCEAY